VIIKLLVTVVSTVEPILSVIKPLHRRFFNSKHIINIIHHYVNVVVIQVLYVIERLQNVWIMLNVVMEHANVRINLFLMKIKYAVGRSRKFSLYLFCLYEFSRSMSSTDTKSPTNSLSRQLSTIY
jgi:hypothetical protein